MYHGYVSAECLVFFVIRVVLGSIGKIDLAVMYAIEIVMQIIITSYMLFNLVA
jgi:hypothetical protein